ncbi:SDR family NAD(P)-dependent oxidoreductase [Streptomyces sp. UG1]|uniref:SDR family NAD(P)-dependent oxidoreductase n=1 Tax=Streptomyces sp. UG1 TaxID=3417652 RepID=UPI003CF2B9DB
MRNDDTGMVVLVTGASSGIGALSTAVADLMRYGTDHQVDVQAVELDVTSQDSADLYDVNVLGTQRVNRAALPKLREQGSGLLVWIGSSSTRGGCPPFLAPYFAAKAAMDALAIRHPRGPRLCRSLRSASPTPDGRSGQAPGRAHPAGRRRDRGR